MGGQTMTTLQFKCTLLTDVVLNAKTATEGPQYTIDFIPGNCFLGIVANNYELFESKGKAADLFHKGTVRYGDAHPAVIMDGVMVRSLRIPASFYYPKLMSLKQKCYVHHVYKRQEDRDGKDEGPQQLKQCRSGFYGFHSNMAIEAECPTSFSIKSAYDRQQRRAKDEQMYGYQSLDKGMVFLFEVEVDNDALVDDVRDSLCGRRRIGRSRTAQYGLVDITPTAFSQPSSSDKTCSLDGNEYVTVYADSRLVFLDDNGYPTTRIDALKHLGIDGEIDWMKSQVRTFQYAPWNFRRQCRDSDRYGVEKGSVFVVKTDKKQTSYPTLVGAYRNEGFGKVIVNPEFLTAKTDSNGLTIISFKEASKTLKTDNESNVNSPLLSFLRNKEAQTAAEIIIFEKVRQFSESYERYFKSKEFASQWGSIRSIAMRCKDSKELRYELYEKKKVVTREKSTDDPTTSKTINMGYLTHGVAENKWKEKGRLSKFKGFVEDMCNHENKYKDIVIEAVIELASEMAKKSRKNGNV